RKENLEGAGGVKGNGIEQETNWPSQFQRSLHRTRKSSTSSKKPMPPNTYPNHRHPLCARSARISSKILRTLVRRSRKGSQLGERKLVRMPTHSLNANEMRGNTPR